MTLKNKITTLKNLIEMRQLTLNDPKFDIKKSCVLRCVSFTKRAYQTLDNYFLFLQTRRSWGHTPPRNREISDAIETKYTHGSLRNAMVTGFKPED